MKQIANPYTFAPATSDQDRIGIANKRKKKRMLKRRRFVVMALILAQLN